MKRTMYWYLTVPLAIPVIILMAVIVAVCKVIEWMSDFGNFGNFVNKQSMRVYDFCNDVTCDLFERFIKVSWKEKQ